MLWFESHERSCWCERFPLQFQEQLTMFHFYLPFMFKKHSRCVTLKLFSLAPKSVGVLRFSLHQVFRFFRFARHKLYELTNGKKEVCCSFSPSPVKSEFRVWREITGATETCFQFNCVTSGRAKKKCTATAGEALWMQRARFDCW